MLKLENVGKALLIVDKASCHKIDFGPFKNINVIFMPPNLTRYCQPCDMGLFATVTKVFRSYRPTTQKTDVNPFEWIYGWLLLFWKIWEARLGK